ncbi:MAG TPA: thiamine diphosphokinase [Bdellovibrionota bacterium]|nr:thiamine diphosphokinase [Bdellovibrionota bacterium]
MKGDHPSLRAERGNLIVLVALAGELPRSKDLVGIAKKAHYIIAADGAYLKLKEVGITPHLTLGDFDSLKKIPTDCKTKKFQAEKDKTDGELALEEALQLKPAKIIVVGFFGGREDHVLGHYVLMQKYAHETEIEIIGNDFTLYVVTQHKKLIGKIGDRVSLITLNSDGAAVSTTGLKYTLSQEKILPSSLGISNEAADEDFSVEVYAGVLFLFHYK